MRISVLGCGYLGAVHAAAMACLGHDVLGVDVDAARVNALAGGRPPFYEPGLDELLRRTVRSGRLRFTTSPSSAELAAAELHFITVGTPQSDDGSADLSAVESALDTVLGALPHGGGTVVVGKSTVPVGTAARLAGRLAAHGATLVWNPEFLREGRAVQDTLHPDRIVYGLPDDPDRARHARETLDAAYAPLLAEGIPRIATNYPTAELVKMAANSFLATKISFINAMAELCETTGGDVVALADALGHDDRIGRKFLRAGVGFGGGCLPKDIRAFVARAEELGAGDALAFLKQVDAINQRRRDRVVGLAEHWLGGDPAGARITVLGAAFKPDSDDIRDSPALDVAQRLADKGAHVRVCDPRALGAVERHHPGLDTCREPLAALAGAELVLLLTEWQEFTDLDPAEAAGRVARPVLIDGRNALDPGRWREAGWTYLGLGRPQPGPAPSRRPRPALRRPAPVAAG
ncbi:UDP-glucose dehydrogenase family protein [Propionibacterium australiense]|uniref:UDP-glucose 6-dehydrogenase n=1 Tax=Propionibacterium australiense TaxID=119981 RepID=A0A383S6Y7_9ACTN|nr:UDP-glucose/GDP-mannose dehydrogenase family protein [Propionibacterium australiense]RLP07681.1 nucleotide sugar dehydrogenase [Propionibacterium australiense]RLP08108.1 nucleotide sugar dehydrogenase [Propionibacterium australiense]SYZ33687.1 UDP-glucose 6-dehydrogenase [Propionibacterium australiense]VEH92921.1 UDP-glucose 6-dehydrogenase tuaD [Propionibacterium australiense]